MVIFNSVGYFTLVLCDFPSQCYMTLSTFRFLRFYLFAMPSLPPELRLSLFSSGPPPCYKNAQSAESPSLGKI
jgi:hypothetical protein